MMETTALIINCTAKEHKIIPITLSKTFIPILPKIVRMRFEKNIAKAASKKAKHMALKTIM